MLCVLDVGEGENRKRLFLLVGGRMSLVSGGEGMPREFRAGHFAGELAPERERVAKEVFPRNTRAQKELSATIGKLAEVFSVLEKLRR